jgi:hypothetical protein
LEPKPVDDRVDRLAPDEPLQQRHRSRPRGRRRVGRGSRLRFIGPAPIGPSLHCPPPTACER